jgi:hypothetical protein
MAKVDESTTSSQHGMVAKRRRRRDHCVAFADQFYPQRLGIENVSHNGGTAKAHTCWSEPATQVVGFRFT